MFRRSLNIFALLLLLVLGMTLGYALLNQSGPEKALEHARELIADDRPSEAIQLLYEAQDTLGPGGDRELLIEVGTLRYRAHQRVGNYERALRDVQWLQDKLDVETDELQRDRVRLLVLDERIDRAIDESATQLAKNPGDTGMHELAGLAQQRRYEKLIEELQDDEFRSLLGGHIGEKARQLLLDVAFRIPGSGESEEARRQLRKLLRANIADSRTFEELDSQVDQLHEAVLASKRHYRAALAGPGLHLAALEGYALQLRHAHRELDAGLLAYLYLQRMTGAVDELQLELVIPASKPLEEQHSSKPQEYPPEDPHFAKIIPAQLAMESFHQLGLPEMVLAVRDLWLPEGGIAEHLARNRLRRSHARTMSCSLLVCEALLALGRKEELQDFTKALEQWHLDNEGRFLGTRLWYMQALRSQAFGDNAAIEHFLREYHKHTPLGPKPKRGPDLLARSMRSRIDAAKAADKPERVIELYTRWLELRPSDPDVRLDRAYYYLSQGKGVLATGDAEKVIRTPGGDRDRALQALLIAQEMLNRPNGRDSGALLAQLIESDTTIPRVPHPVIHLGIAGRALAQASIVPTAVEIAARNARMARETYPWSLHARYLAASTRLLQGDPEQAAHEARLILEEDPKHALALELRLRALRQANAPDVEIQRAALALMRQYPEEGSSGLAFARSLLRRSAYSEALLLTQKNPLTTQPGPDRDEFQWIAIQAHEGLKDWSACCEAALSLNPKSKHYASALHTGLHAAVQGQLPERIRDFVRILSDEPSKGQPLLEAAEYLEDEGWGSEARRLFAAIQAGGEETADARGGRFYVLWGRLLLGEGKNDEARQRLESALSFEDGSEAWSLLIAERLLAEDMKQARWLRKQVVQLSGPPALRAWVHQGLGELEAAEKALDELELPVERLVPAASIVMTQLIEAEEPENELPIPMRSTGWPGLDALIERAPRDVFDCLLLGAEAAFADRALAAAKRVQEVETSFEIGAAAYGWRGLLEGNCLEMLGKKSAALERYIKLCRESYAFAPTYRELFRLGRSISSDVLARGDLVLSYLNFVQGGLTPYEPEVFVVLCKVTARDAATRGNPMLAEKTLETARLLAPRDPDVLRALFLGRMSVGDVLPALELAEELIPLLGEEDRREVLHLAFKGAYDTLRDDGPGDESDPKGTERRNRLIAWSDRAQVHLRSDPAPLAYALALRLQALPIFPLRDNEGEAVDKPARQLCAAWAESFAVSTKRTVHEDGLEQVFTAWFARDEQDFVLERLERVLARDPSLLQLWLLHARVLEKGGRPGEAYDDLVWLRALTPTPELLAELARIQAVYGLGDAQSRQDLLARLEELRLRGPEDPLGTLARGLLRFRNGDFELAQELLTEGEWKDGSRDAQLARYFADLTALLLHETDRFAKIAERLADEAEFGTLGGTYHIAPVLGAQLRRIVSLENRAEPGK
jgi:hypothetical protein